SCMFSDQGGFWRHEGWGEPAVLNGVVHLVYAQHGTGADAGDVYYIRSTDSGVTFSAPFKLNTDATTRPQWQPNISVSPGGTVFAMWYDGRESTSCAKGNSGVPCYRMWARKSTDNGATWLTDMTFSDVVTPLPGQSDPFIVTGYAGDYDYGSASLTKHATSWDDGRVAISGASQQDTFFDQEAAGGVTPTPTPTATPSATPTATPGPIQLRGQKRKVNGMNTVRLNWTGATSSSIDVYRDDVLIATAPNAPPFLYTDFTGDTGRAQYTYRVCEAGTQTCSNDIRVRFPE
ncbi:MAG TPA: sialidase family protein, partial [Candidatus Udaeobacter sp.]